MEIIDLENDIHVLCVKAKSFPEGIMEAFATLEKGHPNIRDRTFYGISFPQNGTILYRAAAQEDFDGEAEKLGFEHFTILKGKYLTELITNFRKDPTKIGVSFQKLLTDPRLDKNSYCLEWYKDLDDVLCMIKLKE